MTMQEALTSVRFDATLCARPLSWREVDPADCRRAIGFSGGYWAEISSSSLYAPRRPEFPSLHDLLLPWEVVKLDDFYKEISGE